MIGRRKLLGALSTGSLAALAGCQSEGETNEPTGDRDDENDQFDPDSDDEPPSPVERVTDAEVAVTADVPFRETSGSNLALDLYRPHQHPSRPAIVLVHGGGWEQGSRTQLEWHAEQLATEGFVCACVSYRLSQERRYPAAVRDVNAAIAWLRDQADEYGIDPDWIATFGWSSGAQLAALAAVTGDESTFVPESSSDASTGVQAMVGVSGLYDFTPFEHESNEALEQFLGGTYQDVPDRYHEASPITHVSSDDPPTLLLHGGDDDNVPFGQSQMYSRAFEEESVPAELVLVEEGDHSFFLESPWDDRSVEATADFLYEHWGDDSNGE